MENLLKKIDKQTLAKYQKYLVEQLDLSPSTTKRRLSSARKFFNWAYDKGYLQTDPLAKEEKIVITQEEFSFKKPFINAYKKYHSFTPTKYLHWALLIIFCAALGFGAYEQFFKRTETPLAYPSTLSRPNRYLSFQGRLTDSSDNPITSATNTTFKLWKVSSGGTEGTCTGDTGEDCLWTSQTCSVTPDQDGIFSILLGTTSGSGYTCSSAIEIPATVFSENQNIYLGVKVASDDEMTPRIQIATVGYALNAETLQGYPPGTTASMIPYINSSGNVVIAAASPTLQASSGTFAIEGQTGITIQAASGQNGSIALAPKGTGTVNLTSEATTGNLLNNQGGVNFGTEGGKEDNNLYYGYVGLDTTNFNLLKLEVGETPSAKFTVDAEGNASASGILKALTTGSYFTGDITVSGGTITGANSEQLRLGVVNDTVEVVRGASTYTVCDSSGNCVGSAAGIGGSGTTNRLAKFTDTYTIGNSGLNDLSDALAMTIDSSENVGIGTTNPSSFKLQIAGNVGPETDDTYDLGSSSKNWKDIYLGGTILGKDSGAYLPSGKNLLKNAAFVDSNGDNLPDYWTLVQTPTLAIATDTLFPAKGGNQITITATGAELEGIEISKGTSNWLKVLPSTTYTFSFDYKCTAGDALSIWVRSYNGATGGTAHISGNLTATTATRQTYTFTTDADADNLYVLIRARYDGDICIISHPKLEQSAIATPYTERTLEIVEGGTGTTTGSITGTGALTFAAGGTNQNVTLTPSGTGYTILNGNVGIGTATPSLNDIVVGVPRLHVYDAGSAGVLNYPVMRISSSAGVDEDNTGATLVVNTGNDRGIYITGGRGTGNQAVGRIGLINYAGTMSDFISLVEGGNVGIGTTSPTSLLSIGSSSQFQVDSSGDIVKLKNLTYSWPSAHTTNGLLTNDGSGTLTWGTIGGSGISPDSLDFTEFQDTMDLDAALTLNQAAYTWTQNFTGTTTTGLTYNANSLTSGSAIALASTATGLTGDLATITLSGSNAANTGSLLSLTNSGTLNTNTTFYLKHYATGTGNLAMRVDDVSGDTTPFVIDGAGNVGIGTTGPGYKLEIVGSMNISPINYIYNGSFENGAYTGWSSSASIDTVTSTSYSGSYSFRIYNMNGWDWRAVIYTITNPSKFIGKRLSFSFWMRGDSTNFLNTDFSTVYPHFGTNADAYTLSTSNGSNADAFTSSRLQDNNWYKYTGTFIVPAGTTNLYLSIPVWMGKTPNSYTTPFSGIYIDNVSVTEGAALEYSPLAKDDYDNILIGGNVGIGTTSPGAYKLNVAGNVSFNSGGIYSDSDNYFHASRLVDSANSDYFVDPAAVGTSATFFGNVGIGNTNPTYKLDVSGDVNFTGAFREDGVEILSGMISAFTGSCPTGWTEYTAARGRTIVGTPSAGTGEGTVGTALTDLGTRTITDVPAHIHSIDPPSTNTSPDGAHSHTVPLVIYSSQNLASGSNVRGIHNTPATSTTTEPDHTHSVDIAAFDSASTGVASVDVTMPYIQLTYCKKNAGADLAEWMPASEDISSATIVSIDPNNREKVIVSKKEYDPTVVGIIATQPGWLIGEEEGGSVQMALAGRVPTQVSLMNGEIKPGDPITTSPIPGVGMKATKSGPIVGKAMEALNETSALNNCLNQETGLEEKCGTILVFVNISWFSPENSQNQEDTLLAQASNNYYELLRFGSDLTDGDLVTLIYEQAPSQEDPTRLETITTISKTHPLVINPRAFAGVISTNIGGKGDLLKRERVNNQIISETRLIFSGIADVKISPSSQVIESGDYLTLSEIDEGMATKTTKVGQTIGKALESWSPDSDQETLQVLVGSGWYDPDVYLTSTGELNISNETQTADGYQLKDASGQLIERIGAFAEMAVAKIKAGLINTQELVAEKQIISPLIESEEVKTERISLSEITPSNEDGNITFNLQTPSESSTSGGFGKLIIKGEEGQEVASIDATGNASFSGQVNAENLEIEKDATVAGTLYADEIVTKHGKFGDLLVGTISATYITQNITNVYQNEASDSSDLIATDSANLFDEVDDIEALIAEILNTPVNGDESDVNLPEDINLPTDGYTFEGDLLVLGTTSLSNTSITDSLNIGGTLSLANNSIDTFSRPLYLQSLGLGGIDILAGKIVIDEHGNATFEGDITIKGKLAAKSISPLEENDLVIDLAQIPMNSLAADEVSPEATQSAFGKLLVKGVDGQTVASIDASGSARFVEVATQKLVIASQNVEPELENQASGIVSTNATAGKATLAAGETEITIKSPFVTENTLVYVTPITDTQNKVLFVKAKKAVTSDNEVGWFKVGIDVPINSAIEFNWWVIN